MVIEENIDQIIFFIVIGDLVDAGKYFKHLVEKADDLAQANLDIIQQPEECCVQDRLDGVEYQIAKRVLYRVKCVSKHLSPPAFPCCAVQFAARAILIFILHQITFKCLRV